MSHQWCLQRLQLAVSIRFQGRIVFYSSWENILPSCPLVILPFRPLHPLCLCCIANNNCTDHRMVLIPICKPLRVILFSLGFLRVKKWECQRNFLSWKRSISSFTCKCWIASIHILQRITHAFKSSQTNKQKKSQKVLVSPATFSLARFSGRNRSPEGHLRPQYPSNKKDLCLLSPSHGPRRTKAFGKGG